MVIINWTLASRVSINIYAMQPPQKCSTRVDRCRLLINASVLLIKYIQ